MSFATLCLRAVHVPMAEPQEEIFPSQQITPKINRFFFLIVLKNR